MFYCTVCKKDFSTNGTLKYHKTFSGKHLLKLKEFVNKYKDNTEMLDLCKVKIEDMNNNKIIITETNGNSYYMFI